MGVGGLGRSSGGLWLPQGKATTREARGITQTVASTFRYPHGRINNPIGHIGKVSGKSAARVPCPCG